MSLLKGIDLEKQDGTTVKSDDAIANAQIVLLYFSAHWCPPCRGFTPVLKDFYEEVKESGDVVIIFVSSDRSAEDMKSYFTNDHGDYYAVPFSNKDTVAGLKKNCQVSGIPKLCLVDKDGNLKFGEVRGMMGNTEPKALVKELAGRL